jgi:hypothetical protein
MFLKSFMLPDRAEDGIGLRDPLERSGFLLLSRMKS